MNNTELTKFLRSHSACEDSLEWLGTRDLVTCWAECRRGDWMIWLLINLRCDDHTLRKIACAMVRRTPIADGRTVWDLLTDERSRNAVEVAERYADGSVQVAELYAARAAAWAAAMEAARAAAMSAARDAAMEAASDAARAAAEAAARSAAVYAAEAAAMSAAVYAAWAVARAAALAAWDAAGDTTLTALSDIIRELVPDVTVLLTIHDTPPAAEEVRCDEGRLFIQLEGKP